MRSTSSPMLAQEPAAPFLLTLGRARRTGIHLPDESPREEHRLAALLVVASLLRRDSWEEEIELPGEEAARIPSGVAPIPDSVTDHYDRRAAGAIQMQRCTACVAKPGFRVCRICEGRGQWSWVSCSCKSGYVECPTCRGTAVSHRLRIRYYHDRAAFLRETYLPTVMRSIPSLFSFERTFEERSECEMDPPECLRCHDLTTRKMSTAYRGGGDREVMPEFHGHQFGDTIERAIAGLTAAGVGKTAVRADIRAYAWPLLWLRYDGGREKVLFVDRSGEIQPFEGA